MAWGSRVVVALDAQSATGLVLRGRRAERCVVEPLAGGALWPVALEPNIRDAAAVGSALTRLRAGLIPKAAVLILPHGVAWLSLLEVPEATDAEAYVAFRLGQELPYSQSDAVVGWLDLGRRRLLAAAVRRSVVSEYEDAVTAAGFGVSRVDLAPLASLEAFLARSGPAQRIDVALGDAASMLTLVDRASVQVLRSPRSNLLDTPERLQQELFRTATLGGLQELPEVRLAGSGAARAANGLRSAGVVVRVAATEPVAVGAGAAWWEASP